MSCGMWLMDDASMTSVMKGWSSILMPEGMTRQHASECFQTMKTWCKKWPQSLKYFVGILPCSGFGTDSASVWISFPPVSVTVSLPPPWPQAHWYSNLYPGRSCNVTHTCHLGVIRDSHAADVVVGCCRHLPSTSCAVTDGGKKHRIILWVLRIFVIHFMNLHEFT